MLRMSMLCLSLIFISAVARAQTIDSALGYFPLHVGDTWHYAATHQAINSVRTTSSFTVRVSGDTVIDGDRYFLIDQEGGPSAAIIGIGMVSIDSASGILYQYLLDGKGKWYREPLGHLRCEHPHESSLLCGDRTTEEWGGSPRQFRTSRGATTSLACAYGIGQVYARQSDVAGWSEDDTLVEATIDGRVYNMLGGIAIESTTAVATLAAIPNPCTGTTTVTFTLVAPAYVRLELFDPMGRSVRCIADERREAGRNVVAIDATGLAAGVYHCRLTSGESVETCRIVVR